MYKDPYIRNEHGTDVTHNTVAHSSVFNQDMHEKTHFRTRPCVFGRQYISRYK